MKLILRLCQIEECACVLFPKCHVIFPEASIRNNIRRAVDTIHYVNVVNYAALRNLIGAIVATSGAPNCHGKEDVL